MTIVFVAFLSFFLNIPLGRLRSHYRRFSAMWFVLVHLSVPLIIFLRLYLQVPPYFSPLFIFLAIAGQQLGAYWLSVMKRFKAFYSRCKQRIF